MDWSNELILEFIELYENHPVLWNRNHPGHKSRNTLKAAWQKISRKIGHGVTVDALRKKKESLMTAYNRCSKKVRNSEITGPGAKEVFVPSWFAYAAIDRFMSATTNKIPSFSSEGSVEDGISQDAQDNPCDEDEMNDEESTQKQSNRSRSNLLEASSTPERSCKTLAVTQSCATYKRKGAPNNAETHVTKHLKQTSDDLTALVTTNFQTQPWQDDAALYGQLLAAKLRRLSKRSMLILQNKIDNLVFEAELNEMDDTSFITSQYVSSEPSPTSSNPSF